MVHTKTINAVLFGDFALPFKGFNIAEIVIVVIKRHAWLVMPLKQWFCTFYIYPFGKSLTPPFIVLGYGVELGKV